MWLLKGSSFAVTQSDGGSPCRRLKMIVVAETTVTGLS